MKTISKLDYAYAVGRVRALENQLIVRPVFLEAALEGSCLAAFRVLADAGSFREADSDFQNGEEVESYLGRELQSHLHGMRELFLDPALVEIVEKRGRPSIAADFAEKAGMDFIRDYFRRVIDLGNLKVAVRGKYLEVSSNRLEPQFLAGGTIPSRDWGRRISLSWDDFGASIKTSPYYWVFEAGMDGLRTSETFIALERSIENELMRWLKRARWMTFGPEPVFAYTLAKQKEIDMARLLLMGKLLKIPPEMIKNRMSETYV